eukprot:CAMPEP_0179868158 /NCGR_PEP_ID=MMETSP0982-20121206/18642_1 /TAXON_ID=483367 /ORGANISM="non described non described, Strain CCMP 2436" /LENGTH=47 /DNA_ID= /DNA_START= /DNA_END= /DNA_ORIENTATION=
MPVRSKSLRMVREMVTLMSRSERVSFMNRKESMSSLSVVLKAVVIEV